VAVGLAVAVAAVTLLIAGIRATGQEPSGPVKVLVARSLIPRGTAGTAIAKQGLYQVASVPSEHAVARAIGDPAYLQGRVAAVDIYPGQQLSRDDFAAEASAG
jgi:hypothetical protein